MTKQRMAVEWGFGKACPGDVRSRLHICIAFFLIDYAMPRPIRTNGAAERLMFDDVRAALQFLPSRGTRGWGGWFLWPFGRSGGEDIGREADREGEGGPGPP